MKAVRIRPFHKSHFGQVPNDVFPASFHKHVDVAALSREGVRIQVGVGLALEDYGVEASIHEHLGDLGTHGVKADVVPLDIESLAGPDALDFLRGRRSFPGVRGTCFQYSIKKAREGLESISAVLPAAP